MRRRRAVVVGGGIAGLVAARVLSDHFDSVTVFEKDARIGSTSPRTGAAQGAHLHVLLQRGQEILQTLFPGIEQALAHCPTIDWAADTKWETARGACPRYPSEILTKSLSRPFLEGTIYSRVAQRSNVIFQKTHVEKIELRGGLAEHLECVDHTRHSADLFVLAGGQHFPLQRMLASFPIEEQTLASPIGISYRSIFFKTDTLNFGDFKQYYYQLSLPKDSLGAVICPVEDGQSIATIIEYGGTRSPKTDLDGFLELAKEVPGGKFTQILANGAPLSAVSVFHKPSMYLRRPHRVSRFPENIFTLGDVFCSLNPAFAQGMTMALEQALLLQKNLETAKLSSRKFHRKSAQSARLPFLLSKIGSSTENGIAERYLHEFLTRCQKSVRLHKKFLNVFHLKASYGSLVDLAALGSALFPFGNSRG